MICSLLNNRQDNLSLVVNIDHESIKVGHHTLFGFFSVKGDVFPSHVAIGLVFTGNHEGYPVVSQKPGILGHFHIHGGFGNQGRCRIAKFPDEDQIKGQFLFGDAGRLLHTENGYGNTTQFAVEQVLEGIRLGRGDGTLDQMATFHQSINDVVIVFRSRVMRISDELNLFGIDIDFTASDNMLCKGANGPGNSSRRCCPHGGRAKQSVHTKDGKCCKKGNHKPTQKMGQRNH
mmetsp:Transcript_26577/g.61833  ORF Transcript_26577/g.61833 Transcript_26577/m.61833 type:complete len:232 (-) Transcript_26577:83-778(-)